MSDSPFPSLSPSASGGSPAFGSMPTAPAPSMAAPVTPAVAPSFATAVAPTTPAPAFGDPTLDEILTLAFRKGASDIHFSANAQVRSRVDGELVPMPDFPAPLTRKWLSEALNKVMSEEHWDLYEKHHEADISHSIEGISRFRVNVFQQLGLPGAVFRIIPTIIKTIEELGVPQSLKDISKKPKGLVLVTGPTGSGKSTTLAAMIDAINESRSDHIMTIEDPIEFVHKSKKSLVNQREVGADTASFAEALKRVLRQDPDVILVGELRDPETIAIALTAAETGHLVFGTLHTQSASKTIDRIVDSFSPEAQGQIKAQLADTLQAVVAQTLMKKVGGGRVAATEIMIRTPAIANMIREGQIAQLYSSIQTGSSFGMHTLDQDLQRLVGQGLITKDHARPFMVDAASLDSIASKNDNANYSDDWEN